MRVDKVADPSPAIGGVDECATPVRVRHSCRHATVHGWRQKIRRNFLYCCPKSTAMDPFKRRPMLGLRR